jgi:hypothetical protein
MSNKKYNKFDAKGCFGKISVKKIPKGSHVKQIYLFYQYQDSRLDGLNFLDRSG